MQLQKLLYFCHGWNLEIRGEPLVADSFQAWQYGPVHPSVYREFRYFGSADIVALYRAHSRT
ncbi:MAG: Panacea domain-containing protein, partial [Alphaproteobacteria bacterium]